MELTRRPFTVVTGETFLESTLGDEKKQRLLSLWGDGGFLAAVASVPVLGGSSWL